MHKALHISSSAFAPFEEEVTCEYALSTDSAGTVRRLPVRVSSVQGRTDAGGAGAPSAQETGDRMSVLIRFTEWPMEEAPAPGTRFVFPDARGVYVVKGVTAGPIFWTCRCTRNMRGAEL